ncbi:glycerol uptake operon antiterminator regulatory protein [Paenibacillus sp. J31TS4]|uniref:glycerol-3-phosphate responsive antiterminator n=1 Tax=Paenibacillus sp. J31TS4 TaxID=2807195 RepID=UPI001B1319A6|nr:glycerol-3-phosphate responsive antiterminator [Paenibacillus sp. J31TS4]GIP40348.1 glycerol uptake operon antiterminator regulatory protein [Paenibacillus sp. J31TS4]
MSNLPIIASMTKVDQLELVKACRIKDVILMAGDVLCLQNIVEELHRAGKTVYVHIEMVDGIGRDAAAVQYLADVFNADGLVSTKTSAISAAKLAGLKTIQRVFAIDTAAFETAVKMINSSKPDKVELMPGLMPRVIRDMKKRIRQPLIVGGLIRNREEILTAVKNGADYVSIGDPEFW